MHVGKRQKVIFTFSLDDSSKHDFQSLSNSVFSIQYSVQQCFANAC